MLAVVIIGAVIATFWTLRSTHHTQNDCAAIEPLGPQWSAMQQSIAKLGSGPGDTSDLLKIAEQESAMSDKIRAAASSVTAPDLEDQLSKWADGAALSAKAQRDAATAPAPAGGDADTMRAAQLTFDATAALGKSCPNLHL
ncbi:hypothetical protein BST42_20250 [Mycolicibacterium rhodesiae]|uniref:Uncharacterized protein n=2 Tax=Mycolicibacterium rhodesiae TaxID=36814 RepID=A0A1X0IQ08_MYCRH|nr:hypothetical protein BST42_20250 [Mycolicibacterium rhodesiae]